MIITLIGVDPGIIDTGAVAITIDTELREWSVRSQSWTGVTSREQPKSQKIVVDKQFLRELKEFAKPSSEDRLLIGVEGYRQRGKNIMQDQNMLHLVQETNRMLGFASKIVDNTGIKNVVREPLLRLFCVHRFPKTHHADLKSAARVALKRGIADQEVNGILSDFVRDNLGRNKWLLVSTPTK